MDRVIEETTEKQIFKARNVGELIFQKKTVRGLQIIGAGSTFTDLPQKFISTKLIHDLRKLQLHERYIDIGPGVTLGEILALGEHCPVILSEAIKTIANPFVRNFITVGGNVITDKVIGSIPKNDDIADKIFPMKMTLYAPLLALDAQVELQSSMSNVYIPLQKFQGVPQNYILVNIRIPRTDWEVSIYRRLGAQGVITQQSASFAFLVDSVKSIITNIRICFAGVIAFRAITLENKMLGLHLPLNRAAFDSYITEALNTFDNAVGNTQCPLILRTQFENLVAYSLEQLA